MAEQQGVIREGRPCVKCNTTARYISNGRCVACKKQYGARYDQSPQGKAAQQRHEHTPKRKASRKAARSRFARSDGGKAAAKRYSQSKKGKATSQKRYRTYSANLIEYQRRYRQTERGKAVMRVGQQTHRAKFINVEGSYSTHDWLALKQSFGNRCLCCHAHEDDLSGPLEQDHVIPLSRGGTNWITNIQPLCRACNSMGGKGTKVIDYRPVLTP